MPDTNMTMNLQEIQCLRKPKPIHHTYIVLEKT